MFAYLKYKNADEIANVCQAFRNEKVCIDPDETLKVLIVKRKQHKMVEKILTHANITITDDLFHHLCRYGFTNRQIIRRIVDRLIETQLMKNLPVDKISLILNTRFITSCQSNNLATAEVLMGNKYVDPNYEVDTFANVCKGGDFKLVKLFLNDSRVDPSVPFDYPIRNAIANGHLKVVQMLIKRIDITAARNSIKFSDIEMMFDSCHNESLCQIIRLILKKGLIDVNIRDPIRADKSLLGLACQYINVDLIATLLHDYSVNPSELNNQAIKNLSLHYYNPLSRNVYSYVPTFDHLRALSLLVIDERIDRNVALLYLFYIFVKRYYYIDSLKYDKDKLITMKYIITTNNIKDFNYCCDLIKFVSSKDGKKIYESRKHLLHGLKNDVQRFISDTDDEILLQECKTLIEKIDEIEMFFI
jgi:hypothetical protein